MGREQIVDLAIDAENVERPTSNLQDQIGRVEKTELLDRLWKRRDRIYAGRTHPETFFVQQPSGRVSGLSRCGHTTGGRCRADDFRSDQNIGRRSDHTVATRHKTNAGLLSSLAKRPR